MRKNTRILTLVFVVAFLALLVGCLTPPNQTPILTSDPITVATVGVKYTYDVNATDPDGDTLTYSFIDGPEGMVINSTTGVINWIPSFSQVGDNPVVVKVSDGSLSIAQSFIIEVSEVPPVNQAPVITSTPVTTATVGITYFYDVNATDPDGDALTYSLTAYPPSMTISSANGLIMWTPTPAQVGNNLVTVMVSDGVLIDIQSFTIVVSKPTPIPINHAPVITSTPSLTATVGIKYIYTITAIDPDSDPITYSLFSKPTGMTFDGIATISWIPVLGQVGNNGVTVKASDGELVTSQNFTIKVSALPPANQAPIIYSIPITTATVGVTYFYNVYATDLDNDVLTYSLTAYPSSMTISSASGLIMWTPTAEGVYTVVVKVSDGALSDTQGFTIKVSKPSVPPPVNHAPIITSIPEDTAIVNVEYIYEVKATDPDGDTLTYSLITKPGGMLINSTTGLISWTPTEMQVGVGNFTVKVSDGQLSDTQTFGIIVRELELGLIGIKVDPKTMTLFVGETDSIKSVTATYEFRGYETDIALGDCEFMSSDLDVATVSNVGKIETIEKGTADILVSYKGKFDTVEVTVIDLVHNINQETYYHTIQAAINDASAGDTIEVVAGTYNEHINIDKSLTIESIDGAEDTTIDAQGLDFGVLIHGMETVVTFEGFTVENYGRAGILAGSKTLAEEDPFEVHILNNIVKEPISQQNNNCIQVGDGTTGTIIGNEVFGALLVDPDWSGSGILVVSSSNVLVSNNHVHDCEGGIQIQGWQGEPAENNVIEYNLVENNESGIVPQMYSIGTIIRHNDVLNNDEGIAVMAYVDWGSDLTPSGTEIHSNNIFGNTSYGVRSGFWGTDDSVEQVDATDNWWGDTSGPSGGIADPVTSVIADGSGDAVSDNVRFDPWTH